MKSIFEILIMTVLCRRTYCEFDWATINCSIDREPVQKGLLPPDQMGRFPWVGLIQHDFSFSADKIRYSLSGAVLIHPTYALAPAEDMAKIDKPTLSDTTHFIIWYSGVVKFVIGVEDYSLHPEYEGLTFATTALVQLVREDTRVFADSGSAMHVCMPIKKDGTFGNIYAVRVTDENGEYQKEILHMDIVEAKNCDLYDEKAEPEQKMMVPTYPICAHPRSEELVCLMQPGSLLVSRESDTYWTLLGFGVRGPNCMSPARYIYVMSQMDWIESNISS